MDRDKIFEQIENIFELCNQRNKGFNETELDIKETITDYISKNFVLCGVVSSLPSKERVTDQANSYAENFNKTEINLIKKQAFEAGANWLLLCYFNEVR